MKVLLALIDELSNWSSGNIELIKKWPKMVA
jgi:hypothetical protein